MTPLSDGLTQSLTFSNYQSVFDYSDCSTVYQFYKTLSYGLPLRWSIAEALAL